MLPFEEWRANLGCDRLSEYRHGYQLPHPLVSDDLIAKGVVSNNELGDRDSRKAIPGNSMISLGLQGIP